MAGGGGPVRQDNDEREFIVHCHCLRSFHSKERARTRGY